MCTLHAGLLLTALTLPALAGCTGAAAPTGAASPHGEGAHHDHGAAAPSAHVKAPGDGQIGDTSICPSSGEEFVITASSPKVEHEGKTYYMCCAGCAKKFQANPAKYLGKPST